MAAVDEADEVAAAKAQGDLEAIADAEEMAVAAAEAAGDGSSS